jgi:hypothetical protein
MLSFHFVLVPIELAAVEEIFPQSILLHNREHLSWHSKYQLLIKAYLMKFAFSSGY